ncbi:MAG: phosphate ABC transporter substrate-binding protein PstS [Nitrospirae bacterium]|nr:phosphate ABC transporter substrate-binding protein PstS [Nitrospirota bacterium]MCL5285185.1 phosphate ABC transporter substrate-binding protein PstS [Nitrospirota bacterium]
MERLVKRSLTTLTTMGIAVVACALALVPGRTFAADLSISGSTMLVPLEQVWAREYMKHHPGVHVSIAPTGSGAGMSKAADGNVTIGASDAYLTRDLKKRYPSLVSIPVALEDTQVIYNLPGLSKSGALRMDGPTLSAIYRGKIRFWDDKAIRAMNPGVNFPHRRIRVLHRADASGTTFVFTDYLNQTSKDWFDTIGRDRSPNWPAGQGYKGSAALVHAVRTTPGAIGYAGLGWVRKSHLKSMALKNREGRYIVESAASVQAAALAALHDPSFPEDFNRSLVWKLHGKDVYPDVNFEFWTVSTTLPSQTMRDVKRLLVWVLTRGQSEKYTDRTGFAPLPFAPLRPRLEKIMNRLLPGNSFEIETGG